MKISEIKEKNLCFEDLEIKRYLPLLQKQLLCDSIVKTSIKEENGIKKILFLIKTLGIDMAIVKMYTNIEPSSEKEVFIEEYDYLKESGLLYEIIKEITVDNPYEIFELQEFINNEVDQEITNANCIEGILAGTVEKLLKIVSDPDILPNFITKLVNNKDVKSFLQNIPNMPKLDTLITSNLVVKPKKNMLGFLKSVKGGK